MAETGRYLHLAKDGSEQGAPVWVGTTASLTPCAPLALARPLLAPCQLPHLLAQPFGRARHPNGGALMGNVSPFKHTWPPQAPAPVLVSQALPGASQPCSAPPVGVPPVPSQEANQPTGAPPRDQGKGSGCSNPQQHWLCPASRSWAAGPEPVLGTAVHGPADGTVSGAPGLEPGGWG